MATRVEDAAKCPKCGEVGALKTTTRVEDERTPGKWWDLGEYECATELCVWFGTGWAVQSDENGLVYERPKGERGMDKTFTPMSPDLKAAGRAFLEDIVERDLEEPFDPENPHEIRG